MYMQRLTPNVQKDDFKNVKQHNLTWYFAEKYIFLHRKEDKSAKHVDYVTDLFAQSSLHKNTIYYFQYQKE